MFSYYFNQNYQQNRQKLGPVFRNLKLSKNANNTIHMLKWNHFQEDDFKTQSFAILDSSVEKFGRIYENKLRCIYDQ